MKKTYPKRPNELYIEKELFRSLNDRECQSEVKFRKKILCRDEFFSPNPFKLHQITLQNSRLKPINIKEKSSANTSPTSSGFSIRLPEIASDGSFRLNKYYFPPINKRAANDLMKAEECKAIFRANTERHFEVKDKELVGKSSTALDLANISFGNGEGNSIKSHF